MSIAVMRTIIAVLLLLRPPRLALEVVHVLSMFAFGPMEVAQLEHPELFL